MSGRALQLTVDLTEARALAARLTSSEFSNAIGLGLRSIGAEVQGVSRASYLSGPRPSVLDRASGNLARSITVDESNLPNSVSVGTDLIYGPVHEFGATITARGPKPMFFGSGNNRNQSPFTRAWVVHIPARPYLEPALFDVERLMAELMVNEVRRVVEGS